LGDLVKIILIIIKNKRQKILNNPSALIKFLITYEISNGVILNQDQLYGL
jgi:hypothetical protein